MPSLLVHVWMRVCACTCVVGVRRRQRWEKQAGKGWGEAEEATCEDTTPPSPGTSFSAPCRSTCHPLGCCSLTPVLTWAALSGCQLSQPASSTDGSEVLEDASASVAWLPLCLDMDWPWHPLGGPVLLLHRFPSATPSISRMFCMTDWWKSTCLYLEEPIPYTGPARRAHPSFYGTWNMAMNGSHDGGQSSGQDIWRPVEVEVMVCHVDLHDLWTAAVGVP